MRLKLWETARGLDPAVEAYTVGDDPSLDARLLRYEVLGSLAHAAGLARSGLLSAADFARLAKALRALAREEGSFRIGRAQEDVHTAVEQRLTRVLGSLGARIHAGRSRNDQVAAGLRLFVMDRLLDLHSSACRAAAAWSCFGRSHERVLMPGYTHLQRAMPTTLGHWAASHAEALIEDARLLEGAFTEADACPLGSAAGYGAELAPDRALVARLLGFSRVHRNTLRVQSSRPRLDAVVLSALAVLARDLGTLAWDVSLFTTAEFGFLRLDEAFCTGSSLMPHKRNPDVVELTRARAALFGGWLHQVLSLGSLPSGYHRDYQLAKGPLMAAFDTAGAMLGMAGRLPEALTADRGRCRAALDSKTLAAQKAMELVKDGMPFREAYRQVARGLRARRRPARAGSGDPDAAQEPRLPSQEGCPGNPGWEALSADLDSREAFRRSSRARLDKAWALLLRGGLTKLL